MRRRSGRDEEGERPEQVVDVPHSPVNEQVVLAAAMVDGEARARLVARVRPEHFLVEEYRAAWAAVLELERRKLDFDLATLQQVGGGAVNVAGLAQLAELRPEAPSEENVAHHVEALYWDRQRAVAVQGPLSALLEALRKPSEAPERVRALARQVAESFSGGGSQAHMRRGDALVAAQLAEIRQRSEGRACYPYGIPGLDRYEQGATNEKGQDVGGRYRMTPGAAPGEVTVITAVSGGGKSTFAAHVALGLRRQGRRVLYGAWEMGSEDTLELLACLDLGWSRTDLIEGAIGSQDVADIEQRMHEVSRDVVFMDNPFQRQRGGKESNERNLDLIHQHIADSGCEVFIVDPWDRCLVADDPSEEKRALWRQHAIAEETRTHCVLLAQQRLKDIEQRPDKHPTREGVKGSSAWVDMADTMIGTHRPALWKRIPDDVLEVDVLKQRKGAWPLRVEFRWDAEFGSIEGGRSVPYEQPGEGGGDIAEFRAPNVEGRSRRRHKRG